MAPLQSPTSPKAKGGGSSVMSALQSGTKNLTWESERQQTEFYSKNYSYVGLGVVLFLFNVKIKNVKLRGYRISPV